MRVPPASVLVPLLVLSLGSGCQSGGDKTGTRSDGFPAPDRAMVYSAAVDALRAQGFTTDSSASSEADGLVTTRYKLTLAPFSGLGYREIATVRIREVLSHAGSFTVEVNVQRQYNDDKVQPSNPVVADWGSLERVPDLEGLIKSRIEMRFLVPDASPEFRRERGLPAGRSGRLEGLDKPAAR